MKTKDIEYDLKNAYVGSASATGYIMKILLTSNSTFDPCLTVLKLVNFASITKNNNLKMIQAFIDDLVYLQKLGVTISFK